MDNYRIKKNINAFLFTAYFTTVWMVRVYIVVDGDKGKCLLFILPIAFLTYALSCKGFQWLSGISAVSVRHKDRKKNVVMFITTFIGSLLLILPWFIARYPGSFSPDSVDQYGQALSGVYSDWHPYWHTFLFFTLPLKITGWTASIVLFQMIYFSLALGYLSVVVYKIAGLRIAVISLMYILLNPDTGHILLYPWKDVAFAIAGLVSMTMAVDYCYFKEEWEGKGWRFILLGIILANATLFRHNAVLLTVPVILALWFQMRKKQWIQVVVSFLLLVLVVKVPFFHILDVEKPSKRVLETVGLPMTVIGNVAKETPEALDDEMAEFVYSIAPQELWQQKYVCGSFNSIKWQKGADVAPIDDAGASRVLEITAKCFARSPRRSLMALFSLTKIVYGLENDFGGYGWGIYENEYGIAYAGNDRLSGYLDSYSILFTNSICGYFEKTGLALLLMLMSLLAKIRLNRRENWKKVLLWLPVFVYDFGTMLLLSGADVRFFYVTIPLCPLIVVYAFYSKGIE